MLPREAVDVNLETDPNIDTKVDQNYTQDVDWVRTCGNWLREADELDTQQCIAGVKRKASQDVNVTDCTLSIGDFVHIRVRAWTDGKDPIHMEFYDIRSRRRSMCWKPCVRR